MNLIAFNGRAGAGKDTAADFLVKHAGFHKMAFADALRAEVAEAFQLPAGGRLLHDREFKEQPTPQLALARCENLGFLGAVALATSASVTEEWLATPRSPRQVMQWWGTEYRRAQDVRYWVKAMNTRLQFMASQPKSKQRFVITDCRFANEYAAVRSTGGKMWRVLRAGLPDVEGTHASAGGLDGIPADVTIHNDGDLLALRSQVLRHWWATDSGIEADKLCVEVLA